MENDSKTQNQLYRNVLRPMHEKKEIEAFMKKVEKDEQPVDVGNLKPEDDIPEDEDDMDPAYKDRLLRAAKLVDATPPVDEQKTGWIADPNCEACHGTGEIPPRPGEHVDPPLRCSCIKYVPEKPAPAAGFISDDIGFISKYAPIGPVDPNSPMIIRGTAGDRYWQCSKCGNPVGEDGVCLTCDDEHSVPDKQFCDEDCSHSDECEQESPVPKAGDFGAKGKPGTILVSAETKEQAIFDKNGQLHTIRELLAIFEKRGGEA